MSGLPKTAAEFRRPLSRHHGDVFGAPQYTDWVDEERSWKSSAYIGDWSRATLTLQYSGPDAIRLFSDTSVNSYAHFPVGSSKHVIHTNDDGKVIEEGVVTRTGEQTVRVFSTYWAEHVARTRGYDVEVEFLEEDKYHVQGPRSLAILEKVTDAPLRSVGYMSNVDAQIAGVDVRILRQGMSGEVGFEVQVAAEDGQRVYDAILEAGTPLGLRRMGGRVVMLNHLQASYPTLALDYIPAIFGAGTEGYLEELDAVGGELNDFYWGVKGSFEADDISGWYRSPVELGWRNRIKFDHDFPGADALRAELAAPKRTLVTLRWNAEDLLKVYAAFFDPSGELPDFPEWPQDPRGYMYSDKVLLDGELIGATSSRGYSAHFRETISHAVIDIERAVPGTEVTVVWGDPGTRQFDIRAIVAPTPYKEVRSRGDLSAL